jgi:hypothetical protein
MLKCCICGADLGEHDGYVRGSISGEVIELIDGSPPRQTGQKNQWEGIAICLEHFEAIPQNIAENIALIKKKRELDQHDNRP